MLAKILFSERVVSFDTTRTNCLFPQRSERYKCTYQLYTIGDEPYLVFFGFNRN